MNKKIFSIAIITSALLLAGCKQGLEQEIPETPVPSGQSAVPTTVEIIETVMSEAEARQIAESECIKGGESIEPGYYNEYTKTWWFDANLNVEKEGCNPACVVSEDGSVEINWRCTGLIMDKESIDAILVNLFAEKYPDYADTVSVTIEQQTENHARGAVIFAEGEAGGIFLAAKVDGQWQIVHDGNGQIPCSLDQYGFPADMLSDCAD